MVSAPSISSASTSGIARASAKSALRDQLRQLFSKVKLPSSPALATKILELAEDPDASVEDFAETIQLDGALAARLMKMSNAASLGQRTPVTTIPKAVRVLGLARVKTAALGFQLVGHLNRLGGCPFDMAVYWQHAALRGCLAREFAKIVVPKLQEEAFLVGLLQDTGILLLVQILGRTYADLYQHFGMSQSTFFEKEMAESKFTHVEASAAMAMEWSLPEAIAAPIGRHHTPMILRPDSPDLDRLCAVSYLVGNMRFSQHGRGEKGDDVVRQYAVERLQLSEVQVQNCLAEAAKAYEHMAELLGDALPDDVDVTELLSEANAQLTQAAGEAEEKASSVIAEQQQLKSALGEYRERAARDPLTGLLNRGALTDATTACLSSASEQGTTICAVFLDVDNFKKLNDRYGHQTGDEVLKAVAAAISKLVVNAGCAGRYGGEEFVLAIPGLSSAQAEKFGQAVCATVRAIDYKALKLESPVTVSVGVAFGNPADAASVEALFHAADALMYRAKQTGKDRFVAGTISMPPAQAGAHADGRPLPAPGEPNSKVEFTEDAMQALAGRLNQQAPPKIAETRKESRQELFLNCKVTTFTETFTTTTESAFVRNLSTSGMSLLMPRPLTRGRPVEVMVQLPDKTSLYAAGLVAHCRQVQGQVHEIGVQTSSHSRDPIFSKNPMAALVTLPWLSEALRNAQGSKPS